MTSKITQFIIAVFFLFLSASGGFSEELTGQSPTPNLAVSNPTQNSIHVRWETIAGATRYELSFGTDEGASNRRPMFVSNTKKNLTRLLPNTIYRVKVRAIIGGRAAAWSKIQSFSTQIPMMTDLEADTITDTSVHLNWSDRYRDLPDIYYELSYGTDTDASVDGFKTTEKNFTMVHDLNRNATYYIKIRASNPKTQGPWSLPISITTLPFASDLAPSGLSVRSGNNSSAVLNWHKLANASTYDIAYGTDPIGQNIGLVPTENSSFTFHLSPNTQYYFKVRAIVNGTTTPWGKSTPFLTLPSKPRGVSILGQTNNQAIIGWQSLAGSRISRYYHIQWGTDSQGTNTGTTITANATYTLKNLFPNRTYAVRVRTVNTTGSSSWTLPVSFKTLPGGLKQMVVFDVKHASAKLRWPRLRQASAYELAYGLDVEAGNSQSIEVTAPPTEIIGLIPEATYYARIRPILPNNQVGAWSNIISFTTFPIPLQPNQPRITEITGTYVNLTWYAQEDISTYEVSVALDDNPLESKVHTSHQNKTRISGLKKNSMYYLKLRALNLGGPGNWSEPVRFVTLPAEGPRNFTVSNILPFEAYLGWEPVAGSMPVTYEIRYSPQRRQWTMLKKREGTSMTLKPLDSNRKYRVQVRARNYSGVGPWSSLVSFETPIAPPNSAPALLLASEVSDIAAMLSWKAMQAVTGYELSIGTDVSAGNRGIEKLKQNKYAMTGLSPNTSYYIKIRAFNTSGEGPWSDTMLVTTRPSPPITAPTNLAFSDISENALTLTWISDKYYFQYEVSIGTDGQGQNSGQPKAISTPPYIFNNLTPKTTYFVKVRNINRGGGGPWSRILKITTPKE
ncbi:fibronectin type III domain-containing protein [bacterium]|nr:fibronectin type III domain-containing protein [bacterium]